MAGIKRNLIYNLILTVSQLLFPIVSIPYISRILDPTGLGRVSFMDSFAYYFVVIAEAGIVTYGIREVARKKDDPAALRKIVSDLLSLHIRTSIVSISLFIMAMMFVYGRIGDIRLVWLAIAFLVSNAFSCEWYFWGRENFGFIALRSVLIRSLGLIAIFLLIDQPADYFIYYWIIVASAVATVAWNIAILVKEVRPQLGGRGWRDHLSSVAVMYGISLTYSVMIMLDSVFLGLAVSATAVSFYALAVKIVRMISSLITDPLLVLYPNMVSRLSRDDHAAYARITTLTFQWMMIVSVPLGAGIYLLSDAFTDFYLGSDFFPVSDCLKILAFYPLVKAFGLFLNKQVLMPHNEEKLVLRALFLTMIVFIPLVLILSYYYSFIGTCIAIMIAELFNSCMNFYYAKKVDQGLEVFSISNIIHSLTGSLIFIPVIFLLDNVITDRIMMTVVSVIACAIVYLAWMLIVRNKATLALLNEFRIMKKFKNE